MWHLHNSQFWGFKNHLRSFNQRSSGTTDWPETVKNVYGSIRRRRRRHSSAAAKCSRGIESRIGQTIRVLAPSGIKNGTLETGNNTKSSHWKTRYHEFVQSAEFSPSSLHVIRALFGSRQYWFSLYRKISTVVAPSIKLYFVQSCSRNQSGRSLSNGAFDGADQARKSSRKGQTEISCVNFWGAQPWKRRYGWLTMDARNAVPLPRAGAPRIPLDP